MAKNYVSAGDSVDLSVPTGGTLAGAVYKIGAIIGVASQSAASGTIPFHVVGVFKFNKGAAVMDQGLEVFWVAADKGIAAAGDFAIGYTIEAATAEDATVAVRLYG